MDEPRIGFERPMAETMLNPASASGGKRLENDATPPLPVMVSTSAPSAMVRIRSARLGAAKPVTNATAATPANNEFLMAFSSIPFEPPGQLRTEHALGLLSLRPNCAGRLSDNYRRKRKTYIFS